MIPPKAPAVPGVTREDGTYGVTWQQTPLRTTDPARRRLERMKTLPECKFTGDKGYKLTDVESGMVSMEEFLAQLTEEELCCMVRGEGRRASRTFSPT